jgi:hypothetical protein
LSSSSEDGLLFLFFDLLSFCNASTDMLKETCCKINLHLFQHKEYEVVSVPPFLVKIAANMILKTIINSGFKLKTFPKSPLEVPST